MRNLRYVRYVDDFIIFCTSENEAHKNLAFLAQNLFETRNFKLNAQKTKILSKDEFQKVYKKPSVKEKESFISDFRKLLVEAGIAGNTYEEIDLDDIDKAVLAKIRALNLEKELEKELSNKKPDYNGITFLLFALASLDIKSISDFLLKDESIKKLYPILKTVIKYFNLIPSFTDTERLEIGKKIKNVMTNTYIGDLQFNRMWLINIFTQSYEWGKGINFLEMEKTYTDPLTKREIYLALGKNQIVSFFKNNRSLDLNFNTWMKRAFIAGISCLPKEEKNPWYDTILKSSNDILEKIIISWVQKNPLG